MPIALTATKIATITALGVHRVDHNLFIQRKPNGAVSWLCKFQLNGKRREMGLGAVRHVPLTKARKAAFDAAEMARSGVDPVEARRAERKAMAPRKVPTFAECATEYVGAHESAWRGRNAALQWRSSIETYANPVIGKKGVDQVSVDDVVAILKPIWGPLSETARRVRSRIERVLGMAIAKGYREGDNPARWDGPLSHLLPPLANVQRVDHHAALPHAQMPALMRALVAADTDAARALRFVALTAARSSEVRCASWDEFDFDAKVWTIPASRMKAGKEHRVPLSDAALALLKGRDQTGLVFPGAKPNRPVSDVALLNTIRRHAGDDSSVHGLRSTFRDWCAETGVAREVAEVSLAHAVGNKVEMAYLRSDMLDRRRVVMDAWAKHIAGTR